MNRISQMSPWKALFLGIIGTLLAGGIALGPSYALAQPPVPVPGAYPNAVSPTPVMDCTPVGNPPPGSTPINDPSHFICSHSTPVAAPTARTMPSNPPTPSNRLYPRYGYGGYGH